MTVELVHFPRVSCCATSKNEAQYLYKEIFEDECYNFKDLGERPLIVDVGANIGMFTLYMKQRYPSSKILAFEPAPQTFDALSRNILLHGLSDVKEYQLALCANEGTEKLTYFPNLPGNSTLNPIEKEQQRKEAVERFGEEAVNHWFGDAQELDVALQRLSHFLNHDADITRIDLLKIDVEGAELDVLRGLDDEHWDLVRNIMLEVWEGSGIRNEIEGLLQSKGFTFTCEAAWWAPKDFFMIKASRDGLVGGKCLRPIGQASDA